MVEHVASMCDAAPENVAWIGRYMLARLQIGAGQADAAKDNLVSVMAAILGTGTAQSEVELVFDLAGLFESSDRKSAVVLLGKLALKYLATMASSTDGTAYDNMDELVDTVLTATGYSEAGQCRPIVDEED